MSIIIVGGGMTGSTLALAVSQLTHGQLPIHLVEAMVPDDSNHPSFDARAIALAQETCQQLTRIGIWQVLTDRATAIDMVHVSDRGHFGFVTIEAGDYHREALGQVVELHDMGSRLFRLLKEAPGVILHCPATVAEFNRTEEAVSVVLNDGARLTGQVLIAADGSRSSIGTACGIEWYQRPYGQMAVIANVSTSIAHSGRAFERFTEHGPLAMLPISQGRSSLVWCHLLEKIDEVLGWSDDRFCDELQKAFGWRLGRIIHVGERSAYPLILTIASRFISHRIVLVGNAAQTLHPIAGQGFNLGLRDVMNLAKILAQEWKEKKECGAWSVLCRYQTHREADKETTIGLTDGLVQLFANRWTPLVIGRNAGLMAMELFIPARNVLVRPHPWLDSTGRSKQCSKQCKVFDIAIIGGGIIGLVLACGLQGSGLRVAVLEQYVPKPLAVDAPPALRVSAINAATEKLLIHLGVWSDITASRASCYHGMEVWDKDSFGCIIFNDECLGYSHLGYIVENEVIHVALWRKAKQCADVILMAPAQLQDVDLSENEVFITLQSGEKLTVKLVVGADGANSWLRDKAKIPITCWDYRQHALVATVRTVEPHNSVARQIFYGDGILAFLPLSDPHLCSIVWSLSPDNARQMREAKPKVFNQALCIAFDNRLGLCSLESESQTFPLIGRYARQFAAHRMVLVGDAAHTIHPLAGQGVNLGFMDAVKLTEELCRLHREGKDIGQYSYLRRYERSRKHSAAIMLLGMQGFRDLFDGSHLVKKLLRDIGIKLVDILPGVKVNLLRRAMGLKDLPDSLR